MRTNGYGGICDNKGWGETVCFGKQKSVNWDEDIRRILPGETITFHSAYLGTFRPIP